MEKALKFAKARYRAAWSLYTGSNDIRVRKELEKIMDKAQNEFTYEEFQEFKKTLPGFIEYWENWEKECRQRMEHMFGR